MSLNNKFPKYGKYGIVLVAAITVATAVQAQNITTHYAYAEEVTANDPALNRMLYLDYSAPEDPTISWLTGNVVTPAGYTVRPADELEGYPYYTITGSDGKNYSVGDNITVEDPLVNHANPEDNVLYYRYYSVDPNAGTSTSPSTSESPAPSVSPSTSESPAPSVSPSTSESPNTSEAPGTSTSPSTSESPNTSEAPGTSTSPSTSESPAPSVSPSTSESPNTSEAPAVEKPSQKTDDKTTATDKAKVDKKADSKPAKTEKSKDANSKKAAATKDNSVANKVAEKSNATSAPAEQAKDTTAKTNNPDTGNSQSIVKEAAGTVDTAAVNHNDNNGFLATLLGFAAAALALIGLFQSSKKEK